MGDKIVVLIMTVESEEKNKATWKPFTSPIYVVRIKLTSYIGNCIATNRYLALF